MDEPAAAKAGGDIFLDLDYETHVHELTFLDVDEPGGHVELFDEHGDSLGVWPIPAGADNGVQVLEPDDADGVTRIAVHLAGTGALARVEYCAEDEH